MVLDFTPYVRPRLYGSAIVVADNLLWYGGGRELFDVIGRDHDAPARALLFRMASEQLAVEPRHGARLADYVNAMEKVSWL